MSFPAYPDYKQTDMLWVGAMPKHWESHRLKSLFHLVKRPPRDNDGIVTAFRDGQVTLRSNRREDGFTNALQEIGYQGVRSGDLVIHAMDAFAGAVGVSDSDGKSSPVYSVCTPRTGVNPRYFSLAIRHMALSGFVNSLAKGVRERSTEFRWADASVQRFPVPPLNEQDQIISFIDRETAKIDALIEEQRRLIALLKEKRQAVISHAVTKGLDPHAPMTNSGIEWLGDVPAHWTLAPLKRTAAVLAGYAFAANAFSHNSDNWRLLRGINLSASGIRWNEDTVYWERSADDGLSPWELRAGDVVLGMDRPWIGDGLRVAEITEDDLPCMLLQRVAAVRADCPSAQRFILHCLRHEAFFHHCAPEMTGVSVPHISGGQIEEFRMPVPPADEMVAIAAHIDSRSNEFAALISAAHSAIELLGERRAALISAAITGKIDVRDTAKVLPFPIERARARGLIAIEIIERSAHQATFGRVKFQKIAFLAEAHVGISELCGSYTREAAGPLDRALIEEMESGARSIAGIEHEQPGGAGTTVSYRLGQQRGTHRQELVQWLGEDRTAKLDQLIGDFAALSTKEAEAVATLYGVWNDALSEGASPSHDEIISGFLNDWHPEKRAKFRASELPEWLGWMRRHGIVPTGSSPKTMTGRLFV